MADQSKIVVMSNDPRLATTAPYPVDVRDLGDGTAMLVLSNGSEVGPVAPLEAIPGPPNSLSIGTVSAAQTPSASITGTAPNQTLNLVTQIGPAPSVAWNGDRVTIGGAQSPALTGPVSTVPGPTGKTAYQYAVSAGYTGTEVEFAQATVPTSVSWANLADKPTTFVPAPHTHVQGDVTGLTAALAAKAATTDPRFTDARTPLAHTHPQSEVVGLVAALAALNADTGWVTTGMVLGTNWSMPTGKIGNWDPLRYRVRNGMVYVNGWLSRSSNATVGETMATLPEAARPSRFTGLIGNASVLPSGVITCPEASTAVAIAMQYPLG